MKLKWCTAVRDFKLTLENVGKPERLFTEIESLEQFKDWIDKSPANVGEALCFMSSKGEQLKIINPAIYWLKKPEYCNDEKVVFVDKFSTNLELVYEHARRAVVYVDHAQTVNEFMCDAAEVSVRELQEKFHNELAEAGLDEVFGTLGA